VRSRLDPVTIVATLERDGRDDANPFHANGNEIMETK